MKNTKKTKDSVVAAYDYPSYELLLRTQLLECISLANNHNAKKILVISPLDVPSIVLDYLEQLFALCNLPKDLLTILVPSELPTTPRASISLRFYCSFRTLRSIRSIVKESQAFIYTTLSSYYDVYTAVQLNLPLFGNRPQTLATSFANKQSLNETIKDLVDLKSDFTMVSKLKSQFIEGNTREELFKSLSEYILSHVATNSWILKLLNGICGYGSATLYASRIKVSQFSFLSFILRCDLCARVSLL